MSRLDWLFARPIAHRGLHDRSRGIIENSLSAADGAIAAGYGIECDVQLSRDGTVLVFHDFDLDRLTAASGPVRERDGAELAGLALSGSADRIPTLDALLKRVDGRIPLIVEIKSANDGDLALAHRVVDLVAGRPNVAVKSFDPAVIAALRRAAPTLARGIVAQSADGSDAYPAAERSWRRARADLLHWDETQPDFLSWRASDLPSAAPFLARRLAGIPVMAWTIRSDDEARKARAHADQIVFEGFRPADEAGPG